MCLWSASRGQQLSPWLQTNCFFLSGYKSIISGLSKRNIQFDQITSLKKSYISYKKLLYLHFKRSILHTLCSFLVCAQHTMQLLQFNIIFTCIVKYLACSCQALYFPWCDKCLDSLFTKPYPFITKGLNLAQVH